MAPLQQSINMFVLSRMNLLCQYQQKHLKWHVHKIGLLRTSNFTNLGSQLYMYNIMLATDLNTDVEILTHRVSFRIYRLLNASFLIAQHTLEASDLCSHAPMTVLVNDSHQEVDGFLLHRWPVSSKFYKRSLLQWRQTSLHEISKQLAPYFLLLAPFPPLKYSIGHLYAPCFRVRTPKALPQVAITMSDMLTFLF